MTNPSIPPEALADSPEELAPVLARRRRQRWLWLVGVLVVLVLAGIGWAVWQQRQMDVRAPQFLEKALAYREQGDLPAAIVELKSALQIRPDDPDLRSQLAQLYLELGDGPAAAKELRHVVSLGRSSAATELDLLHAKLLQGEHEAVLEGLGWLESEEPRAFVLKGEALAAMQRTDEARTAFEIALGRDRSLVAARLGMARADMADGNLESAQRQVDAALQLSDRSVRAWLLKSDIALAKLEFEVAKDAAQQVLAIQRNNVMATLNLIQSLLRLERPDDAEPHLAKLEVALPELVAVHYLRGLAAIQLDELEAAKLALQTALNLSPNHVESLYQLASVHFRDDEFVAAQDALRRLLELIPGHGPSWELLASTQLARKQYPQAIDTLQAAIARSPSNHRQLLSLLSSAYASMGDFDAANQALAEAAKRSSTQVQETPTTAVGLEPDTDESLRGDKLAALEAIRVELLRGAVQLEQQDYRVAIETARAAAERSPESPLPPYLKGNAHEGLGDPEQATIAYQRALEIDPSFAAATIRLATLAARSGNAAAATAQYTTALERNPHHPKLLAAYAHHARELGDQDTWLRLLEESRQHNPEDVRSRLALAEFYLPSNPSRALTIAEEALAREPDDRVATLLIAKAELVTAQPERALVRLKALAEAHPDSVEVQATLGSAHERSGDHNAAHASYSNALRRDEDNLDALIGLGRVELARGRAGQVLSIAQRAQQMHPQRAEGFVLEGDAHRFARRPGSAVAAYAVALDHTNDAGIVISLGAAYWDMQDAERAEDVLQDWLNQHPNDSRVRKELAQLSLLRGDEVAAIREYERIVATTPDDFEALNNLAYLYHRGGDARARDLASRAYELAPENPDIMDTYGWILAESGALERAIKILRATVEKSPATPEYRLHLAEALLEFGKNAEARDVLIAVMKSDGNPVHKRKARMLLGLNP